MPSWDSSEIDVELRLVSILGMQGSGKTTLAMTLANDLYERYGDSFACLYGHWLHRLLPRAEESGVLKGKKHILIVIDDATALLHIRQSRKLITNDYKAFWRLRHLVMRAGAAIYTAKVVLVINMHSYMTVTKYLRNTHVLIIKSVIPKWQRHEHEDVTLRWLDSVIVKELTKMRYGSDLNDITAALNKAVVIYFTGDTDIIKYRAKKRWPPNTFTFTDDRETDGERPAPITTQEQFIELARSLGIRADNMKLRALYRALFPE